MIQWIKHLSYKREDLSSDSPVPMENWGKGNRVSEMQVLLPG